MFKFIQIKLQFRICRTINKKLHLTLKVVRLLGFFAFDCANAILDACGLNMSKKHGADFSRQKMFTTFSMILMPLLCGPLIDVISTYRGIA